MPSHEEVISAIAAEIEELKGEHAQLADFTAARNCHRELLSISYRYKTHPSKRRGGWVAQVPNPDADGIWFRLDIHDPDSTQQLHTQPVAPPMWLGEKRVTLLLLEGEATRSVLPAVHAILRRHGVRGAEP